MTDLYIAARPLSLMSVVSRLRKRRWAAKKLLGRFLPEEFGFVPHSVVSRGGVENLPRSFLFFADWLDHIWFRAKRIGFNKLLQHQVTSVSQCTGMEAIL